MAEYFIGVDVGTGSARAGVFDEKGKLLANEVKEITMWKPQKDFVEQSSENIWESICHCVKTSVKASGVDPSEIKGIGFDATCSLVAIDSENKPVTVSPDGDDNQNVIVWMDHRASSIADKINKEGHSVLQYVGGKISPEMEMPKIVWLKENMPDSWARIDRLFDLPDYLTFKATGEDVRSLCSTVCKWTYVGHEESKSESIGQWDVSFFQQIGMEELLENNSYKIGSKIRPIGEAIGNGLSAVAAKGFGLEPGVAVGVSIIDAHAGGVGMIGIDVPDKPSFAEHAEGRLAFIGGTSSCHMAVSKEPQYVGGVWGPYYSAMIPGYWLTEGGQSATGALVDHVVFNHGMSAELKAESKEQGISPYQFLNELLEEMAGDRALSELTEKLHICPYFHGNRSPRANPTLKGMVSGLSLSNTMEDLALLYLATVQAIAYGTRHIIEEMNKKGFEISTIIACGGGTKNPVFLQEHADITGCALLLPREQESVLLGSAMLGSVASGTYASLSDSMAAMSGLDKAIKNNPDRKAYHDKKYKVFHKLYEDQLFYDDLMKEG